MLICHLSYSFLWSNNSRRWLTKKIRVPFPYMDFLWGSFCAYFVILLCCLVLGRGVGYPDLWPGSECIEPLDVSNNFTFDVINGIIGGRNCSHTLLPHCAWFSYHHRSVLMLTSEGSRCANWGLSVLAVLSRSYVEFLLSNLIYVVINACNILHYFWPIWINSFNNMISQIGHSNNMNPSLVYLQISEQSFLSSSLIWVVMKLTQVSYVSIYVLFFGIQVTRFSVEFSRRASPWYTEWVTSIVTIGRPLMNRLDDSHPKVSEVCILIWCGNSLVLHLNV